MKKITFFIVLFLIWHVAAYAQQWSPVTNNNIWNLNTGNVGIGTASPTELLHVIGGALKIGNSSSSTDRAVNMIKIGDGSYIQIGEWEADDVLSFKANKYSFTNGNVGIGLINPSVKLDVNGAIRSFGNIQIGDTAALGTYGKRLQFGSPMDNVDDFWIARYNVVTDVSELRINIGEDESDKLIVGYTTWPGSQFIPRFTVGSNGNVGIGISNPANRLEVNGTIRAKEVKIELTGWPDYVFSKAYNLQPLQDVNRFIENHKHLPDIPSAEEVEKEGVSIGDMQAKLLQKIEELTLYLIQQDHTIGELKSRIQELENK